MFSLSKQDIRDIWGGSDQRMRDVVGGSYFNVLAGSNLDADYTNGFEPRPQMDEALRLCIADPSNDDWIDANGKVMRTFSRVIAPLSGDGKNRKTKWKDVKPANSIRIDLESMQALRVRSAVEEREIRAGSEDKRSDDAKKRLMRVVAIQVAVNALTKMSRNTVCPGSVPIRYAEQSTGRLFAEGSSLQSAPREVRNAALAGCYDYDISNCHWSLINELAERHGHACDAIRHYLANKAAVRNEIAAGAGITPEEAKQCLLMTMYGAPASLYKYASIQKRIGHGAAKTLYSLPAFKRLHRDVMKARAVIVKGLPVGKGGWILNAIGIQIHCISKPKHLLAHILQGLEAQALMAVVRKHGANVQLCVHDGWVTRERLVRADVTRLIRDAIGFYVEVEEKLIVPIESLKPKEADGLVDIFDVPPGSHYPCGFAEVSYTFSATSSPVSVILPSGAVPSEPAKPSLILSLRPKWNDPGNATGPKAEQVDFDRPPFVW